MGLDIFGIPSTVSPLLPSLITVDEVLNGTTGASVATAFAEAWPHGMALNRKNIMAVSVAGGLFNFFSLVCVLRSLDKVLSLSPRILQTAETAGKRQTERDRAHVRRFASELATVEFESRKTELRKQHEARLTQSHLICLRERGRDLCDQLQLPDVEDDA